MIATASQPLAARAALSAVASAGVGIGAGTLRDRGRAQPPVLRNRVEQAACQRTGRGQRNHPEDERRRTPGDGPVQHAVGNPSQCRRARLNVAADQRPRQHR